MTVPAHRATSPKAADPKPLPWKGELARKSIHLLVVALPLGMLQAGRTASMIGLVAAAGTAVAADVARARSPGFERIIARVFGHMMRPRELSDGTRNVRFNGSTLLLVGSLLSLALFGLTNAAYGLIIFLVGDAAAGLLGRRFGEQRWARGQATIVGSAAFVTAGFLVSSALPDLDLSERFAAVLGSAFAEAISPIDDNLVVPVVASAILYFL
jgi:dolichol kinase